MMSGEKKVSWNVKDLIPNGEYYFRVQAVNKIGGGEFIELRNPVIPEDQKRENQHFLFHRVLLKMHLMPNQNVSVSSQTLPTRRWTWRPTTPRPAPSP